jgi:hypothetical protein
VTEVAVAITVVPTLGSVARNINLTCNSNS